MYVLVPSHCDFPRVTLTFKKLIQSYSQYKFTKINYGKREQRDQRAIDEMVYVC